jgi:hypothetical protein
VEVLPSHLHKRLPRTASQRRQKGQGWKEGRKEGRKRRRKEGKVEGKNERRIRRKKENATNSIVGEIL